VLDRQPGHTDVNARLAWIAFWIQSQDRAVFEDRRVEQNDVNAMMKFF
jgi:hypothetical protein